MSAPPPRRSRERAGRSIESAPRRSVLGLSRFAWLVIAIAFAIGLLLFLMLWLDQRNDNDFYRADEAPPTAAGQTFEPLPAPLPAGDSSDNASGMRDRDEAAPAQIVEEAEPAPAPMQEAAPQPPASIAETSLDPTPIASPPPRYPPAAMRRGESGTVLLRIQVDSNGVPSAVDIVDSSRSRLLDRAAIDAVKQWRFRPAQRNGQAVPGQVQVPISFVPGG